MKRFTSLAFALTLLGCGHAENGVLQGYGEAEYVYVAAQDGGVIAQLSAREGDNVAAGARLFSLDATRLSLSARGAGEQVAASAAQAAALGEAVAQAEAQRVLAARNYTRSETLFRDGFVARARLDADRAALDVARAQVANARAQQVAARQQTDASAAQAGLARQRVSDLGVTAPVAGRVEHVYRRSGEVIAAGDPVLALLPASGMKVRFYAPEPMLSRLRPGTRVNISCDGCPSGLTARVSFVAREPQFTPPVIYSEGARERLVYLVEARPDRPEALRPGQPIDVRVP